jgi:hypothetical protein
MNRLTVLGALLVVLLLPTHAVAQTPSSPWTVTVNTDKMTDNKVLTASILAANGEHPSLKYELALSCDGSSVNVTLTTFNGTQPRPIPWNVTRTASGGRVHTYETDPIIVRDSVTKSFRYRIDGGAVGSGEVVQQHTNGGRISSAALLFDAPISGPTMVKLSTLVGHPQEEVQHLFEASGEGYLPERQYTNAGRPISMRPGFRDESYCKSAGAPYTAVNGNIVPGVDCGPKDSPWVFYNVNRSSLGSVYKLVLTWRDGKLESVTPEGFDLRVESKPLPRTLPQTRLLIADVFSDETVEFPFNNLTATQRSTMQSMCFPEK